MSNLQLSTKPASFKAIGAGNCKVAHIGVDLFHGVSPFGCEQSGATPLLFLRPAHARAPTNLPETRHELIFATEFICEYHDFL